MAQNTRTVKLELTAQLREGDEVADLIEALQTFGEVREVVEAKPHGGRTHDAYGNPYNPDPNAPPRHQKGQLRSVGPGTDAYGNPYEKEPDKLPTHDAYGNPYNR